LSEQEVPYTQVAKLEGKLERHTTKLISDLLVQIDPISKEVTAVRE
jgi:hypothetical protein